MLRPLWDKTNTTLYSSIFCVPAGQVCVLFASGLEMNKVRTDASELVAPQMVCVRRLLHGYDGISPRTDGQCGWIFDISQVRAEKLVDELVLTCGCAWQLTACRNIGILGVPGHYRLELNDATAIGVAQIYAELYDANSIPLQVQGLFF